MGSSELTKVPPNPQNIGAFRSVYHDQALLASEFNLVGPSSKSPDKRSDQRDKGSYSQRQNIIEEIYIFISSGAGIQPD